MTRVGKRFEPQPEAQQRYDALYHDVYLRMYRGSSRCIHRIRAITGYPPPS